MHVSGVDSTQKHWIQELSCVKNPDKIYLTILRTSKHKSLPFQFQGETLYSTAISQRIHQPVTVFFMHKTSFHSSISLDVLFHKTKAMLHELHNTSIK